jgi:hypothetical protein
MLLAPRHHGALLFKRQKFKIQIFKKFKKISGCSQLYTLRLCNFSIWNTLSCRFGKKKIKWSKFWKEKNLYYSCSQIWFLLFLLRKQYNVFRIKILYNRSAWSCPRPGDFFWFFLSFEIWFFLGSKNGLHCPPKRCSPIQVLMWL